MSLAELQREVEQRLSRLFSQTAQSDPPRLRLSALGLCPRLTVLSIQTGIQPDLTEAAGILAAGRLFEAFIAEAFEGEEVVSQREVVLDGVTGHIDFYLPARKHLIECKTIAAARSSPDFLPVEHHVVQVHAYLSALYEETGEEHTASLVYFPRENPRLFSVFTFAYDPTWHSELLVRISLLKDHIANKTVPPIPAGYSATKFPCQWFSRISRMTVTCPFWQRCWAASKESAEEAPTEKPADAGTTDAMDAVPMPADLEDLVALLYDRRAQKKMLEAQEKELREQILKRVKELKASRFVGQDFGLAIVTETQQRLDVRALEKVIDLSPYRKPVEVTKVDVFKRV
jgi:hypothetical protein